MTPVISVPRPRALPWWQGGRAMTQPCACANGSSVHPDQTVDDIVRPPPRALELFKRAGITHCCGAHLSLREAAAAAGAPLGALLLALNPPAPVKDSPDIVLDRPGLED